MAKLDQFHPLFPAFEALGKDWVFNEIRAVVLGSRNCDEHTYSLEYAAEVIGKEYDIFITLPSFVSVYMNDYFLKALKQFLKDQNEEYLPEVWRTREFSLKINEKKLNSITLDEDETN